ncbi:hypothetical protein ACK3TF_003041 [Chlorella vulgaris]
MASLHSCTRLYRDRLLITCTLFDAKCMYKYLKNSSPQKDRKAFPSYMQRNQPPVHTGARPNAAVKRAFYLEPALSQQSDSAVRPGIWSHELPAVEPIRRVIGDRLLPAKLAAARQKSNFRPRVSASCLRPA